MISSRHINKIAAFAVVFAILTSALIVYAANAYESKNIPAYQKMMFNNEVVAIDIRIDSGEWQDMLNNATLKEYVTGDVVINGEFFGSVGVRTKGNSSLSQGRQSDDSSYSLHFKMNYNVKGQTYYGLDVFCVNNMMGDATYMKDYISYDIMRYIGVDAPLTNYAKITVNGEDYGFGLLLERYESAYLDRVYDTSAGFLYNVKIQMGQRENFMESEQSTQQSTIPEIPEIPEATNPGFNERGARGGFGGFGGSNGGSLVYNGDELSNYSSIFDNAVFTKKTTEADMQRVITAIKNLNDGTNLEQYWNVDAILRYLAAHTVVVNLDSYSSSMQQNYFIYERDGKITILPWDYGLSFGGFQSGDASSVINFPIDTPLSGVSMEDRPLISKLLEVPEYKEKYHEYLRQIAEDYFNSGLFEDKVYELDSMINGYIENAEPSSTYESYVASLPVFIELGMLRAESISGQLNGTIPSTTAGQKEDSDAMVKSSGISLSDLGSMMGGMGGGRMGDGGGGMFGQFPDVMGGNMPNIDMSQMMSIMEIIGMSQNNALSDEQRKQLNDLGLTDEEIEQLMMLQGGGRQFPNMQGGNQGGFGERRPDSMPVNNSNGLPPGDAGTNEPLQSLPEQVAQTDWLLHGILLLILAAGIMFMMLYKRRSWVSDAS